MSSPPRYRVTTIYLVPSLVHQIVHHPRFLTADFSTVQSVNCGAAYLPFSLAEQLRSRFSGVERVGEGESIALPHSIQMLMTNNQGMECPNV